MAKVLLGVGSNLGDRLSVLEAAVKRFEAAFKVLAVSQWYSYPAVGGPGGQQDFLNGVVLVETDLEAPEVQAILHQTEHEAGRERIERWASRTLDCDLLLFDDHQCWTDKLKVPHPRMITRRFVLEPANEVACDMVHPACGRTIGDLYQHLQTAKPFFCVLSASHDRANQLAMEVAKQAGVRLLSETSPFAGSTFEEALEWQQETLGETRPGLEACLQKGEACISGSWFWEPWIQSEIGGVAEVSSPSPAPKLLMVMEDKLSEFGSAFSRLNVRLRTPALFLSQDPSEAVQDAVGSVLAMMM